MVGVKLLSEGSSVGPVHTAGDLFVSQLVAAVVDGHPTVRLRAVSLGPHGEGFGGGDDGTGEFVAQHLAAVSLLGVLLGEVVQVLAPRYVEIVVITLQYTSHNNTHSIPTAYLGLSVPRRGDVLCAETGHLECLAVLLFVGDGAVSWL